MRLLLLTVFTAALFTLNVFSQGWEELNYTFAPFTFAHPNIGVSHDNMKIGTSFEFQYDGPMELSTDGGTTWNPVMNERVKFIEFDDQGNIYALVQIKNVILINGSLFKSTDNGQNWEELLDVEDYVAAEGFKVTGSGEVYVPTSMGFKYSPDRGETWTDISCPNVPYSILKTSSGRWIVTTYNSGLDYSDDNGETWTACSGDLGNITFGFLQEHPNNGNIYVASFGGILESTDNGESFFLKDPDPWLAMNITEFEISKAGNLYFYGLYGVHESSDAVTWTNISEGLPAGNGYDMDLTDDHIYVVVDDKIYKKAIETGSSGIFNNQVNKLKLNVFPNPSTGSFTILADQVSAGSSEVVITDLNGRTVYREEHQSGTSGVQINAPNLPNGIYLLQVINPEGTGVKRVEIMK